MLGLDEAGVGPGFGNLVACAAYLPENHDITGLADSKKLSSKKREKLFEEIKNKCKYKYNSACICTHKFKYNCKWNSCNRFFGFIF